MLEPNGVQMSDPRVRHPLAKELAWWALVPDSDNNANSHPRCATQRKLFTFVNLSLPTWKLEMIMFYWRGDLGRIIYDNAKLLAQCLIQCKYSERIPLPLGSAWINSFTCLWYHVFWTHTIAGASHAVQQEGNKEHRHSNLAKQKRSKSESWRWISNWKLKF